MPAPGSTPEGVPAACGSPLEIGQIVAGKYRIERQIGRGGMGIVLAATHLQLEHLVAIKVMRRDLLEDDLALDRLLVEARSAARIRSEHVARVLDVGTLDSGAPFIVMEYLEGEDLADLLDRQGALEIEQAIAFMLQSCEALAEVHVSEMVHRDLKPGNLFIARLPDGSPTLKIVDFGISKHIGGAARGRAATTSPQVLGSPFYMAPEQMRAEAVDERSDIWGLGAILFEMLTGRPPFVGETLPEVYAAVLNEAPPGIETLRPGAPPGLDDVVQRCLAKDPAQRFCDVAELAEALAPFGAPASGSSVDRITRMLTHPEPIRARYSSIPAAPMAAPAAPREPESAASSAVLARSVVEGPKPAERAEESPPAGGEAWPSRASRTGAELHPVSAPGAGAATAPRRRIRMAWGLASVAVAITALVVWKRGVAPDAIGEPPPTGRQAVGAGSALPAGSARPEVEIERSVSAAERPPGVAKGGRASSSAPLRTEQRALRGAPPAASASAAASGLAESESETKKEQPRVEPVRQRNTPAAAVSRAAVEPAVEQTPAVAPAPELAAPVEKRSSLDPWDPSSFGGRR